MSTSADQGLKQEGQENPKIPEGVWAGAPEDNSGIGHESGLNGAYTQLVAEESKVPSPREMEVVGNEENPVEKEEKDTGEDLDIETAEEARNPTTSQDMVVAARLVPLVGFNFMYLRLVHALIQQIDYNNNMLTRAYQDDEELRLFRRPARDQPGALQVFQGSTRSIAKAEAVEDIGEGPSLGLCLALPEASSVLEQVEPRNSTTVAGDSMKKPEAKAKEEPTELADVAAELVAVPMLQAMAERIAQEIIDQAMMSIGSVLDQVEPRASTTMAEDSMEDRDVKAMEESTEVAAELVAVTMIHSMAKRIAQEIIEQAMVSIALDKYQFTAQNEDNKTFKDVGEKGAAKEHQNENENQEFEDY